jgi:hypothetical protein
MIIVSVVPVVCFSMEVMHDLLCRDGADLNSFAGSEFSFTSSLAQSLDNDTGSPCSLDSKAIDLNSEQRKVHFDGELCVICYEFQ